MAVPRFVSLLSLALAPGASYAASLYASHYSGTVNLLTFDESAGSLSLTQSLRACGSMPAWLTWDSTNKKLYCTDENFYSSTASISELSAGSDMRLTVDAKATTPSGGVANVLYGDGYIATAHYQSSKVTTFKLPLSSSSTPLQTFTFTMAQPGPNAGRQDAPHPHHVITDPTGAFLLAPDLGADMIRIWSIDQSTGQLTTCPSLNVTGGTGPRHAVFWSPATSSTSAKCRQNGPKNLVMYVANELVNSVSSFAVSYPAEGCMAFRKRQEGHPFPGNATPPTGTKVGEIHVKDNFVYNSNRVDKSFSGNDSIATWGLGSRGELTFRGLTNSYGTYPRTFSINKEGTYIAIGDQTTANVAILKRDTATGALGDLVANLRVGATGYPENEDGLSAVVWAD